MRAPQRVCWASKQDIADAYEWIFSPNADEASKRRGLARLSVYLASPSCPVFIPLLYHLVSASLSAGEDDTQSARLTCAMAVVRFVNGMVDPLQSGAFARPISHIAASLGIPAGLIAIRHRATHEDLPPLPMLLQAVHQAIDYLHRFSFLPLLAGPSHPEGAENLLARGSSAEEARAEEAVAGWKKVMKARVKGREVGEENESGRQLRRLRKELDSFDSEILAYALCGSDGLVPTAKTKRASRNDREPSRASLEIWHELLHRRAALDPDFTNHLAKQLLFNILNARNAGDSPRAGQSTEGPEDDRESKSFRWTLGVWLLWLWQQDEQSGLQLDAATRTGLSERLFHSLISGDQIAARLASALTEIEPQIESAASIVQAAKCFAPSQEEKGLDGLEVEQPGVSYNVEDRLAAMEERLASLEYTRNRPSSAGNAPAAAVAVEPSPAAVNGQTFPSTRWHRLDRSEWRSSPIGVWAA